MIVTLTCENDSTTHEVLYVDKDFEFGAIKWSLSLTPPVGYSRTLSIDQIKLVREDFDYFKSKVLVYGDTLKMVLNVNSRDYLVDLTDYTLYENYVEFGLINTGVEADFAEKKDSEITLTPDVTLDTTGLFTLRELIKKNEWETYTPLDDDYFSGRYVDAGSVIYTNGIITSSQVLIKFDVSYGGNMRVDYDIHNYETVVPGIVHCSSVKLALKALNSSDTHIFGVDIPFEKVGSQVRIQDFISESFFFLWLREAEYQLCFYIEGDNKFIPASGRFANLSYLGKDFTFMTHCHAVTIRKIFDSIFGVGRYVLPTLGIWQLVFVNSDMLNFVPNEKLTIKVSEFLKDVCNVTASAMVFDNGKYQFKPIADLTTVNQLQLPYVKDFKINFSKSMNYTEFEFGSKMPNYKFMLSDRNFFTQKITWQPENLFGQKYSLSLSKLRVDCVGIYDCVRSFVDAETSNNNNDYWAVVIDHDMDTVKPSTITGVDQQTGWFNLDLSPRSQMKRYASLLKSFLNYKPKTIKVSAAENYLTTMAYDEGGELLADYDTSEEVQLFTNLECKFTTMLTTDEISLLQNEMRLLQISVNGQGYMVFPTNIEFTESERQECEIQGLIAYTL
jgi:hypothetical protein